MSKISDYWQELAKKNGIPEDRAKAILEALGDETTYKAFENAFVPRPDYSRDLDKVRDEWKTKAEKDAETAAQYKDWYEKQAKPAYETNLAGIETLNKYRSLYGDLPQDGLNIPKKEQPQGLTRAEFDALMAEHDARASSIMKFIPMKALEYQSKFKEVPNLDEFEQFAVKSGLPPEVAWEKWISPKVQEQQKTETEALLKAKYEEGLRDGASRAKTPNGTARRESLSPFFDRKDPAKVDADAGRRAFMETMNDVNWKEPKAS